MRKLKIQQIAIIGAGLVGCGWIVVFAHAGFKVSVFDADPRIRDAVASRVEAMLEEMGAAGLLNQSPSAISARVHVHDHMTTALAEADYIQESVYERQDVKIAVAAEIGAHMRPSAIVGSSSSGIPASQFTEHSAHRERFLIVHPVNPPHLVPVVELVPAPWTDPTAVSTVRELMEKVGQAAVTVNREIEGFILNRLQGALLNEAWALFDEGYASAEDIDRTVRDGLGLRWSIMGPFETIDLNAPGGVADYAHRLGPLYHRIAMQRISPEPWPEPLIERVEAERRATLPADRLEARSRWRDRRLMALIAHRRAVTKLDEKSG